MTYAGGALMYQPATSSCGLQGWHPAIRKYADDTLTVTEQDGTAAQYRLSETAACTRQEFYSLYADLEKQEAELGTTLIPRNTETLTRYTYAGEANADGKIDTISLWCWEEQRKSTVVPQCWVDYDSRLFDLIANPDFWGPFCHDNDILWDYTSESDAIPIRFDLEGPVALLAKSGKLFTSVNGQMQEVQSPALEIEPGETIYWQPFTDGELTQDAKLLYQYSVDDSRAAQDTLELRCLTDCEGLYATKTYGISNNWFDGITSTAQVLYSTLETDLETGELVVCRDEGTPANNIYVMDSEDFPTEKPETPPQQLGK